MKNAKRNATIIISVFTFFIILITGLALRSYTGNHTNLDEDTALVGIPEINVPLFSEKNGTYHDISVEFFLEVDSEHMGSLDTQQLETDIANIVESMNHDNVVSPGNMDYIKNGVINGLNNNNDVEILNVYISNINTGSYQIVA